MTPSSTLLRQLFPSWAFFDVTGLPPTLQVRLLPSRDAAGGWRNVIRPPRRRWWHVVFNPEGTQTLAAQTLVERCYTELLELGEQTPAYRESLVLVRAVAERAVADDAVAAWAGCAGWQLRIIVTDDDDGLVQVVYESDRWALPPRRETV